MKLKTRISQVKKLQEVINGTRGFVSITEETRDGGWSKEELKKIASDMGLKVKAHGSYGICASRPQ